jgi:hypothetical protein
LIQKEQGRYRGRRVEPHNRYPLMLTRLRAAAFLESKAYLPKAVRWFAKTAQLVSVLDLEQYRPRGSNPQVPPYSDAPAILMLFLSTMSILVAPPPLRATRAFVQSDDQTLNPRA